MKTEFRIEKAIELMHDGVIYDVYNRYSFSGVSFREPWSIEFSFRPSPKHGAGLPLLSIVLDGVVFLEVSPGLYSDASTLEFYEIGYKTPTDNDLDWILSQAEAKPTDDLFISFGKKHYVRVRADVARLVLSPAK